MTQLQALRRIDPSLTRKSYKASPIIGETFKGSSAYQESRTYRASRAIDRLRAPQPVWYVGMALEKLQG